ncbi:hypothetical protein CH304_12875 [Rhodococcus sp. 15-649-1-2]|nr:hypothetical protein CH304_12875 [Rhodococcus sp. 15-649-1-2]
MSVIERPMTTKEVQEICRRGENWVRDAANTGALKCQPNRRRGQKMFFMPKDVEDWIARGCPQMPERRRR